MPAVKRKSRNAKSKRSATSYTERRGPRASGGGMSTWKKLTGAGSKKGAVGTRARITGAGTGKVTGARMKMKSKKIRRR